jgi:hypothetical protein
VVDIAVHSLPARRTWYRNIAIDESQLWLWPKDVLNNAHHVYVCVELTPQPFGCQRRHNTDVLRCFALVPLLELLADVDACILDDLLIQAVNESVIDSVLENYEAIAVVVV